MKSLRSINLNLLPVLRELLVHTNVTRAARALNLSQSATSDALKRLREQFDDPLLIQEGRKMRLTPLASNLLQPVENALSALGIVFAEPVFDPYRAERLLRIGISDSLLFKLGGALLHRLSRDAPQLRIKFRDIGLHSARLLEIGDLDFAIMPQGVPKPANLKSQTLFDFEFVGVADKNNPRVRDRMGLDEYRRLRHVVFQSHDGAWSSIEARVLAEHGVDQNNIIFLNQFILMAFLVAGSDVVAVIDKSIARHLMQTLPIRTFDPPVQFPRIKVDLLWAEHAVRDPAFAWFRQILVECADSERFIGN